MEQRKKRDGSNASQQLSHPLVIKMNGRQWVVGGENATPLEMGASDKLISLSTWTSSDNAMAEHQRGTMKTPFHRPGFVNAQLDKLSSTLDGLLGVRRLDDQSHGDANEFTVQQAFRMHSKPLKGVRRLRETFQFGLIFGLILGCLSLLLFHQLEPSRVYPSSAKADSASTVLAGLSPGFTLPSIHMYTLQTSPYETMKAAMNAQSVLGKQGIRTVLHHDQAYTLWCGLAIHSESLRSAKDRLAQVHVRATVTKVGWNAQSVTGPSGENKATASQVSRWLSAYAGSLTALTGQLADGGVAKDADRAYQTEKSLRPAPDVFAATGYQTDLTAMTQALDAAVFESQKKHMDTAIADVLAACVALSRIQSAAVAFS